RTGERNHPVVLGQSTESSPVHFRLAHSLDPAVGPCSNAVAGANEQQLDFRRPGAAGVTDTALKVLKRHSWRCALIRDHPRPIMLRCCPTRAPVRDLAYRLVDIFS